ncbi:MAG: type II toxin-antitoxin system CcdA family antitoxin, partial [Candidatus Bathyarchaeia archaeon]
MKRRKKERRKTVGITLPPKLIAQARLKGLNISRIAEQALKEALKHTENQKNLKNGKEGIGNVVSDKEPWARSSARLERQAH